MNVRLTAALFVLALLAVGGLLVYVAVQGDSRSADEKLFETLAGLKPDDLDTVEIVRTEPGEQKLTFTRTGTNPDRWQLVEPVSAAADGFAVTAIARAVLDLKPTTYPDMPGLADAGLDRPTLKVTVRKGSDKSATLLVGNTTAGKENAVTFVATGDRPADGVAVRRNDLDPIFKPGAGSGKAWEVGRWLTDYRQKRPLGDGLTDALAALKSIKLTRDKAAVQLDRTPAGDWVFAAPAGYGVADVAGDPQAKPETITGVRPLITALTGMQAFANEDVIEKPEAGDKYGLTGPDALRIELTPKDGKPEVLVVGKPVDDKGTSTKVYAQVPGDPAVFQLTTTIKPDAWAKLVADPSPLRDRSLVPDLVKGKIDAIDVVANGVTAKLRRVQIGAAQEWVLYGGPNDPQIAGPAAKDLLDTITRPRAATDVLPAPYDAVFTPADTKSVVKVWTDGTTPAAADPKKDATALPTEPTLKGDPAYTLTFGKTEGEVVYARKQVGPAKTDLKLPAAIVPVIARDRRGYVSADLSRSTFATNLATKVVVNRGTEVLEVVKDEKAPPPGKWTFVRPDRLKGQSADPAKVGGGTAVGAGLVGLLATLNAVEVAAESPTPEQLKQFGLAADTPHLTATVTLAPADPAKDKPTDRVYEFGNETPNKGSVYAKVPDKNLVYTVPKTTADRLQSDDVRDLTLYTIDPAAVTKINLRGWKAAGGNELEFDRKGPAEWIVAKGPKDYAVDPAKVGVLLSQITSPKGLRGLGTKPLAEHGLDPATAKNPLVITLAVSGIPRPVVLTLGDETDGGAAYFAYATERPEEVVTLPLFAFRALKERVEALKK